MIKKNKIIINTTNSNYGDRRVIEKSNTKDFININCHYLILNGFRKNDKHHLNKHNGMIEKCLKLHDKIESYDDSIIVIKMVGLNSFSIRQIVNLLSLVYNLKLKFNIDNENIELVNLHPKIKLNKLLFELDIFNKKINKR